jgi:hypothetical protein
MEAGSPVTFVAHDVLDTLQGAQIASCEYIEGEGFNVYLIDGRTLLFVGSFSIAIMKADTERLH